MLPSYTRKGNQPSLPHEAFEVAQSANESSAAAAIQKMSTRFPSGPFRQARGYTTLAALAPSSAEIAATLNDRFLRGDAFRPQTYYGGPVFDRQVKGDRPKYWLGRTPVYKQSDTEAEAPPLEVAPPTRQQPQTRQDATPPTPPSAAQQPSGEAALAHPKPLSAGEVQTLLGADEALVFFLVGANESYVFALTRESFEWRTISLSDGNVSANVAAFRRGLDVGELTKGTAQLFDVAGAHELYVALFGPVEALIKDKSQLLIVPSGPLTALPFHLLVTDKPAIAVPQMQINDMAAYREAAWLVKRHAVTVLPSVANLKALRVFAHKSQATKPMIGFGDPMFARHQAAAQRTSTVKIVTRTRDYWPGASVDRATLAEALSPLPDSADELKAVAAKLGASPNDIYLGRNATEANVKRLPLADYRVVYFATHGLVAGDVKGLMEPSLALSLPNQPSELDDGLLTASEVAQLELNADWVVLSACNTAAGEKPGAEALSGLARAFFYAGARALLVSHWGIDSKAAARLTTSTFDIMNSDRTIGRAEALRRAMLAYLDDRSGTWNAYPAFWGSFSLVGEGWVPDAAAVAQTTRMPSFLARLFGGGTDEDGATGARAARDAADSPPVSASRPAASAPQVARVVPVATNASIAVVTDACEWLKRHHVECAIVKSQANSDHTRYSAVGRRAESGALPNALAYAAQPPSIVTASAPPPAAVTTAPKKVRTVAIRRNGSDAGEAAPQVVMAALASAQKGDAAPRRMVLASADSGMVLLNPRPTYPVTAENPDTAKPQPVPFYSTHARPIR